MTMNVKNDDAIRKVILGKLLKHENTFHPKLRLERLNQTRREGPLLPSRDQMLVNPVNLTADRRIDDDLPTGPRP
eukprot:3802140-Rhodomonas_salina.1